MARSRRVLKQVVFSLCLCMAAQAAQPKVNPGPNEPDWRDILEQQWKLNVDRDLRNPLHEGAVPSHMFVRAGRGPLKFTPIIALGREETTLGGYYRPREGVLKYQIHEVWRFAHKQPQSEMKSGEFTPPEIHLGRAEFEPGDEPFGLWVSNYAFKDERVFTDPRVVAATNERLKAQPYKAMIYPNVDPKTGRPIPHSYIIGWEYSDNDDFQDVVTRIDNVRLLPASKLPGITAGEPVAGKVAGDFKFTEGPAWDFRDQSLVFSDIPVAGIVRYKDGRTDVVNDASGESNGLMFEQTGAIIACEHAGRRVSRAPRPGEPAKTIVDSFQGKKLNSPNDLWIDTQGGIYFTDPRYGNRDNMEMKEEAVYYITAEGRLTRIIDDLVRPNGIALSPDGETLYVVDNGASLLYRYPVLGPGRIGDGERIAYTVWPDGMCVDQQGRTYVTGLEGVLVLEPDGKWVGIIASAEQPANCTFGGPDYRTLFITARTSLYRIETQTRGWHVHLDGAPGE